MAEKKQIDKWEIDRFSKRDQFERLLEKDDLRRDVLNEKYFEGLERRRDVITAANSKRQTLVWIGMLFLALSVLSIHLPISIFGLTGEAKNLREILLLALSTIQIANLYQELEKANITDHLHAWVSYLSKNDEVLARALRLRYGIDSATVFPTLNLPRRSPLQVMTFLMAAIGFLGWLSLMIGVFLLIQMAALVDIIRDPSISTRVSVCVLLYVIFADAASLGVHRMTAVVSAYSRRTEKES